MASGDVMASFGPRDKCGPATSAAQLDYITGAATPAELVPVLDFDTITQWYADFHGRLPDNYDGGGLTVALAWSSSSVAGGTNGVTWGAAFRALPDDAEDIDTTAHSYSFNNTNDDPPSAIGELTDCVITFTNGADMDSLAAGERYVLRVTRVTGDAGDDMSGDAELHDVYVTET